MSSVVVAGDTSGSVTIQAPAVAGSTTLTLPSSSGSGLLLNTSMVLLGTLVPTNVNSISISGLTLTPYKQLYFVFNNIKPNAGSASGIYISANNSITTINTIAVASTNPGQGTGTAWLDLSTGIIGGACGVGSNASVFVDATGISTSTTTIYFRTDATKLWTAQGSILIYGVY